jgi:hypothetical protein
MGKWTDLLFFFPITFVIALVMNGIREDDVRRMLVGSLRTFLFLCLAIGVVCLLVQVVVRFL